MEMLAVGAECQRRWREDIERRLANAQAEYFGRSDYHDATVRYRGSNFSDAEALEDVEFARREMAQMAPEDEAEGPRVVSFAVPRPYGVRRAIITNVASWASERFGKSVSPGVVTSAWKLIRSAEAESV